MNAGYVYVIHFADKFHHAQHYIGCSRDVRGRLTAHANGHGANIIKHHMESGGEWTLAGLYNCSLDNMRKIERYAKNWKNSKQFCPTCTPERYLRIPDTLPIDVRLLDFAADSFSLRKHTSLDFSLLHEIVRSDETNFVQFEESMRDVEKPFKEELGFIPNGGRLGIRKALSRGNCFAAINGACMLGFCYFCKNENEVTILQLAVREKYQRNGIARQLVSRVLEEFPEKIAIAKVRNDLPANDFWSSVFTRTNSVMHVTSQSTLNVYHSVPKTLEGVLDHVNVS